MLVIPAIDLRNGLCVRLVQGDPKAQTIYADDPAEVARKWEQEGASLLHVVDLDGAFEGRPRNLAALSNILAAVSIPVEFGGGLRDRQSIEEVLSLGVKRLVIGTSAVESLSFLKGLVEDYGEKIIVGIDARHEMVAVQGWAKTSGVVAVELAEKVRDVGITEIIYTDISRDGTLVGPNIKALEKILETGLRIIASGGIASLEHLRAIKALEPQGVSGVIIGTALYKGNFTLAEALNYQ